MPAKWIDLTISLIDLTVHGVDNDAQPVLAHDDPNSVPCDGRPSDISLVVSQAGKAPVAISPCFLARWPIRQLSNSPAALTEV